MDFKLKFSAPENARGACLIVTVSRSRKLSACGQRVDKAGKGFLKALLKRGDMDGKLGQTLLLHDVPGIGAQRLLLVGCGKDSEMNERNFGRVIQAIVAALGASGARDAALCPGEIALKGRNLAWKARQAVLLLANSEYRFDRLKSDKGDKPNPLRRVTLYVARKEAKTGQQAIDEGVAISVPLWPLMIAASTPLSIDWRNTKSPLLLNQFGLLLDPLNEPPKLALLVAVPVPRLVE